MSSDSAAWQHVLVLAVEPRILIRKTTINEAELMAKMPAIICRPVRQSLTDDQQVKLAEAIRREHEYDSADEREAWLWNNPEARFV